MSTPINDGGPAFPLEVHMPYKKGGWKTQLPGMTLRDWFAGQALISEECRHFSKVSAMVSKAYEIADAMIAAREAKQ